MSYWKTKMNNPSFWASYKAKCKEKGIAPLYVDEEAFNKAMIEPPRPYSTDDLVPKGESIDDSTMKNLDRMRLAGAGFDDVDNIDVEDLEDWEQDAQNAKKIKKGDAVPNIVKWERCNVCDEMKEESAFAHLPNGKLRKTCKQCMAKKISDGHKKNKESTEPIKSQEATHSDPLKPNDAADALGRFIKEAFEPMPSSPLLKEKKPLLALKEETLEALVIFAYKKGIEDAEMVKVEEITPIHAESLAMRVILNLKTGA